MNAGKRENNLATAVRAAVGAVIVMGILFIGATAPRETSAIGAAYAAAPAVEGNGPTGYFPDMFVNQGTGNEPQPEAF